MSDNESKPNMEVPISWFTLKEPLSHIASGVVQRLPKDKHREFIANKYPSMDTLYNVGHYMRWHDSFPRQMNLTMPEQPLPSEFLERRDLTISLSSLLEQVGNHLGKWAEDHRGEEDMEFYEETAKGLKLGLKALSEIVQGRIVTMNVERNELASVYEIEDVF